MSTESSPPISIPDGPSLYTIGHSNHTAEEFMALLNQNEIELLVDVRTRAVSRYRHFVGAVLEELLASGGVSYAYLGGELGGHPPDPRFYNQRGRVVYQRVAAARSFRLGIQKVIELASTARVALMCSEGDPLKCHRHPLLARELIERHCSVVHIVRDGSLRNAQSYFPENSGAQLSLMVIPGEDETWESPKRIR